MVPKTHKCFLIHESLYEWYIIVVDEVGLVKKKGESSKKGDSRWQGAFMCACSIESALHMSSQLKNLECLLGLQCLDGALMDTMWNNCDKLFVKLSTFKILSYHMNITWDC